MQPSAPALEWAFPFIGMLASIALFPIAAPRFWHRRMGSVAFGWSAVLLVQESVIIGIKAAAMSAWHAVLIEYLPFITLLLVLYTAGGGVLLRGGPGGTPLGRRTHLLHHVVDGDGLAQALQRHLADLFELCVLFDRDCDTATDQYLPVLGLAAEASGEIGDRTNRGVVHALGKADLAQGRIALRDANAEPQIVAM